MAKAATEVIEKKATGDQSTEASSEEATGGELRQKYRRPAIAVIVIFLLFLGLKWRGGRLLEAADQNASAGLASYKQGQFDEALSSLEEATRLNPSNTKAQRALGQSYEATGRLNEAAAAYKASLAAKPNQPEVL